MASSALASVTVDGAWCSWGEWSECDASCGGGHRTRTRSCTNPEPKCGGDPCPGDDYDIEECNTEACEPGK